MEIKTGGPAFPGFNEEEMAGMRKNVYYQGMTLRDYFAGQVLTGLCSCAIKPIHPGITNAEVAELSYELSDAMLAEREKCIK